MNLTSKTHFGLKALLDIAYHDKQGPVQRRQIAQRQGIPIDYMDQILTKFREKGLINSLRGREGGYHLAKSPDEISVLSVFEAVEDQDVEAEHEKTYAIDYLTKPAWDAIDVSIKRQLRRCTIADLIEEAEDRMMADGLDPVEMQTQPIIRPETFTPRGATRTYN